jgi:hypothetical protein
MDLQSPKKYLLVPKVATEAPNKVKVVFSVAVVIYFCYIIHFTGLTNEITNHFVGGDCSKSNGDVAATNLSHLVFGIAGSVNSWKTRRPYIDLWWRPNQTRGVLWLDKEPSPDEPWPATSPPFKVQENVSKFKDYDHHGMRFAIRMTRVYICCIISNSVLNFCSSSNF